MFWKTPVIFLLFLCLFKGENSSGQTPNQAPNPGFELHDYCPATFNNRRMTLIEGWKQPTRGTVDYYHACSRTVGIPENIFGTQEAVSGDGYVGLVAFAPTKSNYREYLQGVLASEMKEGQLYCVEFQVSLADNVTFMTDGMGIHFSREEVKHNKESRILKKAQVANPQGHVLDNDTSWMLLSGNYRAKGGEKYLTFGNFLPDDSLQVHKRRLSDKSLHEWKLAYYYLDDIVVKEVSDSSSCSSTIPEIVHEMNTPPFPDTEQFQRVELSSLLFDLDKSQLTLQSKDRLEKVVSMLKENENYFLKVIGHTDMTGSASYNDSLSQERAESVFSYLMKEGIEKHRLKIDYYGSEQPVATNETPEGRAQNRRVEFVIIEKKFEKFRGYRDR